MSMLSLMVTTPLFADVATMNGVTWTYSVSNGKAIIGGGGPSSTAVPTSTSGLLSIPSSIKGYSVASVADYAFYNCTNLTSVTIPNGVTNIGYKAFYSCRSLANVTLPNTLTRIMGNAFTCCDSLFQVTIPNSMR